MNKKIFFSLFVLAILSLTALPANAQWIITDNVTDDFEDQDLVEWSGDTGSFIANSQDYVYQGSYSAEIEDTTADRDIMWMDASLNQNYTKVWVYTDNSVDAIVAGPILHKQSGQLDYYELWIWPSNNQWRLARVDDGSSTSLVDTGSSSANTWYKVIFYSEGDDLHAKAYETDGTEVLNTTYTDNTYRGGYNGLEGYSDSRNAWYDDFLSGNRTHPANVKPDISFESDTTSEDTLEQTHIFGNVTATDSDGSVVNTTIYLENETWSEHNTSSSSQQSYNFTGLAYDTYTLKAWAYDDASQKSSNISRTITLPSFYNVSGYVFNSTNSPLSGVSITNNVTSDTDTTDSSGYYNLYLPNNDVYGITATKTGYDANSTTVEVSGSPVANANMTLTESERTTLLTQYFDGFTAGNNPYWWELTEETGTDVEINHSIYYSGGGSVFLNDGSSSNNAGMKIRHGGDQTIVTVKMELYYNNLGGTNFAFWSDGDGEATVQINSDGDVLYYDGSYVTALTNVVSENTWHHFEIQLDSVDGTVNLSIDDSTASDLTVSEAEGLTLNKFDFLTHGSDTPKMHVDNFRINTAETLTTLEEFTAINYETLIPTGGGGDWDDLIREKGSPVYFNDQWCVYYAGYNSTANISEGDTYIGRACGDSPTNLTKDPDNPIITEPHEGLSDVNVLPVNSTFMYLAVEDEYNTTPDTDIRYYTTTDGKHFTHKGLLYTVDDSPWANDFVGTPILVYNRTSEWYRMWYEGCVSGTKKEGYAEGDSLDSLSDYGSAISTIFQVSLQENVIINGTYYGYGHKINADRDTALFTSPDGIDWTTEFNPVSDSLSPSYSEWDGQRWVTFGHIDAGNMDTGITIAKIPGSSGNYQGVIGADIQLPTFSRVSDNSSGQVDSGEKVGVSVFWEDNVGLSNAKLYHNGSGSYSLEGSCSLSGTSGWCNLTIDTSGLVGQRVCWNQTANDTENNVNNSMEYNCFDVNINCTDLGSDGSEDNVITVDANGVCPYIQLAHNNASAGDTIQINQGTYTEDITFTTNVKLLGNTTNKRDIELRGDYVVDSGFLQLWNVTINGSLSLQPNILLEEKNSLVIE